MRHRLVGAAVAVAVLAGACTGGKGPGSAGQASPPPSPPASGQAAQSCPLSAALPAGANDHGPKAVTGASASIEADDTFFMPTCLTAIPAGEFALTVANRGSALHNLSVPDQGIDMDLEPGQTVTVHIQVGTAVVPFFCKYHRASGMVGSLGPVGSGG